MTGLTLLGVETYPQFAVAQSTGGGAVSFNSVMTGGNAGDCQQTSQALTLAAGGLTVAAGSNRWLVVPVAWDANVTSRTFTALVGASTVAMTETIYSVGITKAVGLYTLQNPDTGVQTITGTWGAPLADCYIGGVAFNNVSSINTADNTTSAIGVVVVTSSANDATVSAIVTNNGDPVSVLNLIYANSPFAPGGAAAYALGGTTTHAYTSTGTENVTIGIHLVN